MSTTPEMTPSVPETPPSPTPSPTPEATPPSTPSEPVGEGAVPANPQEGEPQTPTEQKFKLPDGREVTSQELYDLHVNHLLPDYTKKAQKLSELERVVNPQITHEEVPEWKKPDYTPKNWAEVMEIAKAEALKGIQDQARAEQERTQQVVGQVEAQIAEIKKTEPALDENALFLHATKYGFRDLVQAHENMKALKQAEVDTEQRVLKNLQTRGQVPVSGQPGIQVTSDAIDPNITQKYGSALEFFRSIKT